MCNTLNLSDLVNLSSLANAVWDGKPITWIDESGNTRWGISRAFTQADGGFLADSDDVREGFVWLSGGNGWGETFYPVQGLLRGISEGTVALNYRPE